MKHPASRRLSLFLGLLCLTLTAFSGPARAQATLEVVPSNTSPGPGESLTVDVVISGLGNLAPPSLGAFDLVLTFDPAVLAHTGTTVGTALGDEAAAEALVGIVPGAGDVNVFEVSLLSPAQLSGSQPDGFTLFTVSFDAVASGSTTLGLTPTAPPGDENGRPLSVEAVVAATVTVGRAVPIPGLSPPALLLLTFLLLLAAWRVRREVRS